MKKRKIVSKKKLKNSLLKRPKKWHMKRKTQKQRELGKQRKKIKRR
jgi:hypothetical protein